MLFPNHLILLRGGGDLATGVAYRLHKAGFSVIVTELPQPLVVRRRVALATAVLEGEVQIEDLRGVRVESAAEALRLAHTGVIPVLVSADIPTDFADPSFVARHSSLVIVDARMAKCNIDTAIDQAPLVIALGPGFIAGQDCHAVVETMRGHTLGRVIWQGPAFPNTGTPGIVAGKGAERVLRAPADGIANWGKEIGDLVVKDERIGAVDGQPVTAPFDGVLRGLIAPGTQVTAGIKIGDVDARGDVNACFTISDKAVAIGGGVLEAVLTHLNESAETPS
ncbi:MAG: selenium-dependent molybdenum cofactor biosynthesis protein YqeB [Chloroflexota bacterium]